MRKPATGGTLGGKLLLRARPGVVSRLVDLSGIQVEPRMTKARVKRGGYHTFLLKNTREIYQSSMVASETFLKMAAARRDTLIPGIQQQWTYIST